MMSCAYFFKNRTVLNSPGTVFYDLVYAAMKTLFMFVRNWQTPMSDCHLTGKIRISAETKYKYNSVMLQWVGALEGGVMMKWSETTENSIFFSEDYVSSVNLKN